MDIPQASNLTRHASSQPANHAQQHIIVEHILMRSRGRRLPEVYSLIAAILVADEDETAAADAGVVAAHDADAEDGADEGVYRISLRVVRSFPRRLWEDYKRGVRTPCAKRSLPIVLHSIASLATAPREPCGGLRTYSSACDKPNKNAERSSELQDVELDP